LDEAVAMTRYLFVETVGFTEDAIKKLRQDGSVAIIEGVMDALAGSESLSEASAQDLIRQVATRLGRKEGQLKPVLRVALTGETRGPDLIQSWLLLHQRGWDTIRLRAALETAQG
jgi:glutamyl-tRNA synthetase